MDKPVSSFQRQGVRRVPAAVALALLNFLMPGCSGSASHSGVNDDDDGEDDGTGGGGGEGGNAGGSAGMPEIPPPPGCSNVEPLPPVARRLTDVEILNSVKDALGVELSAEAAGFKRVAFEGFSTDVGSLIPNFEWTRSSVELGERVSAKIQDRAAFAQKFGSCNAYGDSCEKAFVEGLGLKLFRRPVTEAQLARYRKILTEAKAKSVSFPDATQYVLQAMIASASFLYRLEPEVGDGSYRGLDDYEIASRLSFALWATAPDDELMSKAREGKLKNATEREAQVERLLKSDRAKKVFAQYASDWLGLEQAGQVIYKPEVYPDFTPELGRQMVEETKAFIDAFWDEALPHDEILTAKFAFADKKMAEIYGFKNVKTGLTRYDLSGDPRRFGILTQGAILGPAGVHEDEPGIVFRGMFILKHFLCTEPPELTDEIREGISDQIEANKANSAGKSQRFAAEDRNKGGTCGACHRHFDSLAYPFEPYDSLGRWRDKDRFGNELRTDGKFAKSSDPEERSFSTTEEFAKLFAELPRTRACLVANAMHFLQGQAVHLDEEETSCLVESVKESMKAPKASFKDLFRAIALHPMNRGFKTVSAP